MTSGAAADHNRVVPPDALVLAVLLLSTSVMAQAQGLQVMAAREDVPGTIAITVASRERHKLNIFLNELETSLTLQDFESSSPKVSADRNGRKRYEVTYRIKYSVRR